MMSKNKQRLLTLLMTLVMLVGVLPITVFAEEWSAADVACAQGDEVACCEVDEPEDVPADTGSDAPGEYDAIRELLINDASVDFDPATQTFAVISAERYLSGHLQELGLAGVDDIIKEHSLTFRAAINGTSLPKAYLYYEMSTDGTALDAKKTWSYWGETESRLSIAAGQTGVLILNKNDSYEIYFDICDNYYQYLDHTYNGEGYIARLLDHQARETYRGEAGDAVVEAVFSLEWDLCNWLDIELYSVDTAEKIVENPGFLDIEGYVNFKIELRDTQGNITLLPRTYYNNYGSDNEFLCMEQDGIVPIALEPYDDDLLPHSTPYGEFDLYIPFGYDYRITLLDYSVDTLGGYAYVTNQEHAYDADGFCLTDHDTTYTNEWGSFIEFTFMPIVHELRVEKAVEGTAPENAEYTFLATQNVYSFVEEGQAPWRYYPSSDLEQRLIGYPYDLYDSATAQKLNDQTLKTDAEGCFTLKAGQYAVFGVWERPADLLAYKENGFTFQSVFSENTDCANGSLYTCCELGSADCETTITLTREGVKTTINGKTVENLCGGDFILVLNQYAPGNSGDDNGLGSVSGVGVPGDRTEGTSGKVPGSIAGALDATGGAAGIVDGTCGAGDGITSVFSPVKVLLSAQKADVEAGEEPAAGEEETKEERDRSEESSTAVAGQRILDDVPQTGDRSNVTLWMVFAGVSLLAMLAAAVGKKRQSE